MNDTARTGLAALAVTSALALGLALTTFAAVHKPVQTNLHDGATSQPISKPAAPRAEPIPLPSRPPVPEFPLPAPKVRIEAPPVVYTLPDWPEDKPKKVEERPDPKKDSRVIEIAFQSEGLREVHWYRPLKALRQESKGWLYRVTLTKNLPSSVPPYQPVKTVLEGYFFLQDSSIRASQLTRGPWDTQTLCTLLEEPDGRTASRSDLHTLKAK